jgi:NAD(P)-dependent dehydrogenase (short-subunit alcohol dehydrogenase family)
MDSGPARASRDARRRARLRVEEMPMKELSGKVAVVTGAGSGFGLELARIAAAERMRLVLADVQQDALDAAVAEVRSLGAEAIGARTDVSVAADVERLAGRAHDAFGPVHLLFNNAGVAGGGGYVWESTVNDWKWLLGVNVMGVVHGIRSFVPRMIEHGEAAHVVNTASAAGLVSPPLSAPYNASKHAVVALSETLYHDLRLAKARVGVSVLCPAYVPTGISRSDRNRPPELRDDASPTASQIAARERAQKAVSSGKLSAADVARMAFDAIRDERFYVITHRNLLPSVELRLRDVLEQRAPSDPYTYRPDLQRKV